jgi:gamma-glutamylcyclotransferase (GGCT)/AIG2-like uncharacterized protein YtfP
MHNQQLKNVTVRSFETTGNPRDTTPIVGVYGSLRKGLGLHHAISHEESLGTVRVQGLSLRTRGSFTGYPYSVLTGNPEDEAVVELYKVTPETLRNLDMIEGHPSHYCRTLVRSDDVCFWVYQIEENSARADDITREVEGGDWTAFKQQERARYAAKAV